MKGKQPYWPENPLRRYVRAAAKRSGVQKEIGWHTFCHSLGTLLNENGENVKTIQELLRHSDFKVTANTYVHGVTATKPAALDKAVQMIAPAQIAQVGA